MGFTRFYFVVVAIVFASYFIGVQIASAGLTFDADLPNGTVTLTCLTNNTSRTYPTPDNPATAFPCASGNISVRFNCTDTTTTCAAVFYNINGATNYCRYDGNENPPIVPGDYGCTSPRTVTADNFPTTVFNITVGNSLRDISFFDRAGNQTSTFTVSTGGTTSCTPCGAPGATTHYCAGSGVGGVAVFPNGCTPACTGTWGYYAAGNSACGTGTYRYCFRCNAAAVPTPTPPGCITSASCNPTEYCSNGR